MKLLKVVLLHLLLVPVLLHAQDQQTPTLNIGDRAPALKVQEWLKGTPIKKLRKGKVYVVEFWATWCAPCRAAMPHLSELARAYRDKITFIGVDVWERKTTSMDKVREAGTNLRAVINQYYSQLSLKNHGKQSYRRQVVKLYALHKVILSIWRLLSWNARACVSVFAGYENEQAISQDGVRRDDCRGGALQTLHLFKSPQKLASSN